MNEAYYSLTLTHDLCVLPLAYQITCIVGNTLGRTLHGGRSERNEFLLLHAFTQKGYLPPDKPERHKGPAPPTTEEEEGGAGPVGKKNKSSYSGGLVLDPKVGFYNRFVKFCVGTCTVYWHTVISTTLPPLLPSPTSPPIPPSG